MRPRAFVFSLPALASALALAVAAPLDADAETLSVAKLGVKESIVIVRTATADGDRIGRVYLIEAKGPPTLAAYDQPTWVRGQEKQADARRTIGATYLSPDDVFGLDAWLLFLRRRISGDCPKVEEIVIGYYRDDKKIGEERFRDASCAMLAFSWFDGKVAVDDTKARGDFPVDLFNAIVPPHVLEQRILDEAAGGADGKSAPQDTPAGTG